MKFIYLFLITSLLGVSQTKKPDSLQLYFENSKYSITEIHKTQINSFFKGINTKKVLQIKIKGYTDFVGNHVFNNKLSKKRAQATYNYITSNYQFTAIAQQGLGEIDNQLDENNFEQGNSKHRKVDLILSYEKPKEVFVSLTRKQRYLKKLPKLSVGEKICIENIRFAISTANITKTSNEDIDGIIKILKAYPKLNILIEGHVCCGDKEEYESKIPTKENLELSEKRAQKVYDILINRGIKSYRLAYKGYGFTRPLEFPETNEFSQKENRRIELKVLKR
jgi:outer membrane protein OmpA-like peptidoglycan-associated protein